MKKQFCLLALLFSLNGLAYAAHQPINLEGQYDCTSTEVDTHEVSKGVMTLKKTGETYSLKSEFTDGSTYTGTGIYIQTKHIFSVAFNNPKKPDESGVAIAEINKDFGMTSIWTYLNKTSVGHGFCTKRKEG